MGHNESSVKRKFVALNTYIKKLEKSHTSELTEHFKTLEQKEANSPKRTRHQEIIKVRAEINKIETKQYKESMRQRVGTSRKSTK